MKPFAGLTAEQETHQEKCARAQLGAILFADKSKHVYFSKELLYLASPHFVPSPPESPAWQRQKTRKQQPRRPSQPRAASAAAAEEETPGTPVESRSMADMAAFFSMEDDDM